MRLYIWREVKDMVSEMLNIKVHEMRKFDNDGPLKAFCDLSFGDLFVVRGFKVVEGEKGKFIGMPRTQGKNERWYPVFTPSNNDVKQLIADIVMEAYQD